ncbi:hypothetical protein GGR57DRAFT_222593 [Xylariaceae sp. FL1272]|nr:hypothetical protein GGR57DRAFT_222593 [Xylariaceae sp. FL1272]
MTSDSFSPLIRQLTVEPLIPKGLENGDILLRKRVLNTWETSYLVTSNSVSALLSDHIRLLEPVDSTIECYVHRLNENVCIAYGYSRPGSLTSRKSTPIIGLSVFIKSTKSVTESVRIRSTKRSTGATFEDTPPTLVFTSSAGAADYYFRGREKFTYLERMAVPCDEWIFEVVNANNESIGSIRIGTERKFYNFENADGGPADVGSEGYVDVVDFCVWSDWDGKHQVMRDPDMEKGSRHKIG